ncbi:MFS transporter [uncultured Mucilaginibacter sp.]|uniref:MFS transporter n=1 Tax=uncultured Mucilaginibacter sp. TaxID=797541 RepID=UPI0025DA2E10|nr:MFS transporter [uncultured Mucilaginibacter sp.]
MNVFRSLKYRNFKLFFYGQSISLIGTWMQKTAVSWLVYRLTGSALLLGLVSFASLIPSLILSPYAGSVVDRHNRYKILVITQVVSMLQAGALAFLILFKVYNIPAIIGLSLLQGIINAFDITTRQAMMSEMVDNKEDLPNAIALNSTMTNIARIAGPAIAGIILSTFGEDACFFGNFISYIPVLTCLFMMKLNITVKPRAQKSIWLELQDGFKYVSGDRDLSSLIIMLTVSSLFVIPFNTLMPIFAKDIFSGDAKTFSWFESAAGLGSVISAVYLATLKTHKTLIKVMTIASFIFGISVLLLGYAAKLPVALLFMTMTGVGMMAQTSTINTFIQTHAVPAMRARAISYYVMAYQGMIPVGSLLIGWLANSLGPRGAVCVEGVIGVLSTGLFVLYKRRQNINIPTAGKGRLSWLNA